jgi:hypothetical protein
MLWYPKTAGDDLLVRDSLGNILYAVRASTSCPNKESAGICVQRLNRRGVQGLNIEVMDSGLLLIYLL